jgi:hypothetical protein
MILGALRGFLSDRLTGPADSGVEAGFAALARAPARRRRRREPRSGATDAFLARFTATGAVTVAAQVGGDGFNGPSHFAFELAGDRVARMTIRG